MSNKQPASARRGTRAMEIKKGIPVSPGVVIKEALVLGSEVYHILTQHVPAKSVPSEVARFERALEAVIAEIAEVEKRMLMVRVVCSRLEFRSLGALAAAYACHVFRIWLESSKKQGYQIFIQNGLVKAQGIERI